MAQTGPKVRTQPAGRAWAGHGIFCVARTEAGPYSESNQCSVRLGNNGFLTNQSGPGPLQVSVGPGQAQAG